MLTPAAVLGWGYWHKVTHASLHVSINDVALKTDRQLYGQVLTANVSLLDAEGKALAGGSASKPYGVIWIAHPVAGDCTTPGRPDWPQCFETTARWIPTWVKKVRYAAVSLPNCRIERVPVTLNEYGDDWWLWWVPLPHVGGVPYGYFEVSMQIDSTRCQ
jgi:hypothetical protein